MLDLPCCWLLGLSAFLGVGSGDPGPTPPPPLAMAADFDPTRPVGFAAQVGPTLSRLGCNAGACHGRAGGQRGFALSLFGADPTADQRALLPRIDSTEPESSILFLKATGQVPHGGGVRLTPESPESATLLRWVAEQADPTARSRVEPRLVRVEVVPDHLGLTRRSPAVAVRVVAHWADDSRVDVTRLARFESTSPGLVEVSSAGMVQPGGRAGVGAVLARFGPDVAAARVVVGTGVSLQNSVPAGASRVDRLVLAQLDELGLAPGPSAPAREFARRSSLDLTGQLPSSAAVARFEADPAPDRRARWIQQLLSQTSHADYFALKWAAILRNRRTLGDLAKPSTFRFHAWIRQCLRENVPWDRFATSLVSARGVATQAPAVEWYRLVPNRDGQAEDIAQVFLGTRIGCARCHRHPTERWSQADHADFAQFFQGIAPKQARDPDAFGIFWNSGGATESPPRSPRVLGGALPLDVSPAADPRPALAAWMTDPANPLFARSVVNRTWKHFFGQGLVEPEDDLRPTNPASNPALLDALAADFVASGFDYRALLAEIATSDAYARASRPPGSTESIVDPALGAWFEPRPLPAEVLLDAIGDLAEVPSRFAGVPPGTRAVALPDDGFPSSFLDAFGRPERRTACECERTAEPSLTQALFLLNSSEVEGRLADPLGRAARYASAPDARSDEAKLDELYRVALARPPLAAEVARCSAYLSTRRASGRLAEGWQDILWAILNTDEFLLNH